MQYIINDEKVSEATALLGGEINLGWKKATIRSFLAATSICHALDYVTLVQHF